MNPVAESTAATSTVTVTLSIDAAINRIKALIEFCANALQHPSANPPASLLVIAIFAIAALLVLAIIRVAMERPRGRARQEVRAERRPRNPQRTRLLIGLFVVVLFVGLGVGWTYGTSDRACNSCHVTKQAVLSHAEGTHAKARCSSCHVGPGVRGAYLAAGRGARNLVVQVSGSFSKPMPYAEVSSAACESCHEEIKTTTLTARGIRMRHSDVLDVGYQCTDCHGTVGHGTDVPRPRYPQMAQCIQCHDGEKASNACDFCHSQDVGVATRTPGAGYVKADIKTDGCRGCHPMTSCIACHGLELPHSDQFVAGFHARKALLQPKVCMKCHTLNECDSCHKFRQLSQGVPANPHATSVSGFVTWHIPAQGLGMGACSCHDNQRQRFCDYCHAPQPER